MTEGLSETTLAEKARALLAAHHGASPLIIPNVWDVASARVTVEAGFPVVGTSSRAIAGVLGLSDDDTSDPTVIFEFLARIANSVDCPVSADCEAGYGMNAEEFVDHLLAAGLVGCNLEDSDHHGDGVVVDADRQAAYLGAVRSAAADRGVHIVINARIDIFIRHVGDEAQQLAEAIRRGRLYFEAGADCVYPIALVDRQRISRLTSALPGPVNVVARRGGLSVEELSTLGVRRISFASGLYQLGSERLRSMVGRLAESADLESVWRDSSTD